MIGSGSWGTAVAIQLANNGHSVSIWDRDADLLASLSSKRENAKYLPGIKLPDAIATEPELQHLIDDKDFLFFGVPSHAVRDIVMQFEAVSPTTIAVSLAKGIENGTLLRVSQILELKFSRDNIVVVSGPSHAEEVSRGIPTLVVSASSSVRAAESVQTCLMSTNFRVYLHSDVIGVELGAALKNVVAVSAGIIDGVGAGDNTKAALLTRALAEITRLGTKLGADSLTFAGLSGMGDLIVTCMSKYSRNRHLGEQIGRGKKLEEVLQEMVMVAEGVKTTQSAYELAGKHNVEVPIITEAYNVLFREKDPQQAVFDLMTRAAKFEDWG